MFKKYDDLKVCNFPSYHKIGSTSDFGKEKKK